jgi:hypothetical protein
MATALIETPTVKTGYIPSNVRPIKIEPLKYKPLDAKDDCFSGGSCISGIVLKNDKGGCGDIVVKDFTQPTGGCVVFNCETGEFKFLADPGFCGKTTFKYTIVDQFGNCDTACVTLKVVAPKIDARNDCFKVDESSCLVGDVLKNDKGQDLKVVWHSEVKDGKLWIDENGCFKFEPCKDFDHKDETICFTYKVQDCFGRCDTAKVTIKIHDDWCGPVEQPPPVTSMEALKTVASDYLLVA